MAAQDGGTAVGVAFTRPAELMAPYTFEILDARPEERPKNLAYLQSITALGIEMTDPMFAAACRLGNLDPQHGAEAVPDAPAAIEEALMCPLPVVGAIGVIMHGAADATGVTMRGDADAFGAIAVLNLRAQRYPLTENVLHRIKAIAAADKSTRGPWPGGQELVVDREVTPTQAIAAAMGDAGTPVEERLARMHDYLTRGRFAGMDQVKAAVMDERAQAVATSRIEIVGKTICFVESAHRGAMGIGYTQAPVVVACNEHFSVKTSEGVIKTTKYTVGQYDASHCDMQDLAARLQRAEERCNVVVRGMKARGEEPPRWGGTATIIGSPTGISSLLEREFVKGMVIDNVRRYGREKSHETRGR